MTLDSRTAASLLLALASAFSSVEAAPVAVFTGNLTTDDDVFTATVQIDTAGTYRFQSWSYAGGTMADGTVIAAGGFDVILSVFDAAGQLLKQDDDGVDRLDPANGLHFDAGFNLLLDPGSYTLAVTQYDNFAFGPNLSDGFMKQGEGNFTPNLDPNRPCSASSFCDFSHSDARVRTSFFAVDVEHVAPVPLPPAVGLLTMGVVGLGLRVHRGGRPA